MERFILDRSPDSHILEMHIVTEEYLAALMIEVRKSILAEGWAEVTVWTSPIKV